MLRASYLAPPPPEGETVSPSTPFNSTGVKGWEMKKRSMLRNEKPANVVILYD